MKAAFEVFLPLSFRGEIIDTGNNLTQDTCVYNSKSYSIFKLKKL